MRFVLNRATAVLNAVSEELVRRSLNASPLIKPFLTPGGWQLEKENKVMDPTRLTIEFDVHDRK